MITVTTIDGRKFKERQYNDFDKGERYVNKVVYKRTYKEESYQKFSGKIFSDTIKNSLFIQYDSTVRIYLEDSDKKYASLFISGLVYPKMIFCATDSLCKPLHNYQDTVIGDTSNDVIAKFGHPYMNEYRLKNSDTGYLSWGTDKTPVDAVDLKFFYSIPQKRDRYGWRGNSLWVRYITELNYLEKSKHKRAFKFEIAVYPGGYLIANPTDYRYFIELENDNSNRKTKFKDYVKNARISFFHFWYEAHEI